MQGFPVGTVVPAEDLVGREDAVSDLCRRLGAGQHLYVAAPRQVGKTSVLDEVLRRLAQGGHPTLTVMLMGVSSWPELAQVITAEALRAGGLPVRATAAARRLLQELEAAALATRVTLSGAAGAEMSLSLGTARGDDVRQLLGEALGLAERLGVRSGTRAIVCFDEFQKVGQLPGDLAGFLRAAMIRHEHVAYVFLGSRRTMLAELFVRENQPLHRFAAEWRLPGVQPPAWERYLVEKFRAMGLRAEPGAVRELVRLTGGHPYDTMAVAQEAFLTATDPGRPPDGALQLADVDRAYDGAMLGRAGVFAVEWERCDVAAQDVLKRVAQRLSVWPGKAESGRPNPNAVKRALASLLDEGVLIKLRRGSYVFFEPMMEEFVRRTILAGGVGAL